ncbi:MAG: hypothetical protein K5769_01815 [Pseudobutyrivibrio sp.]|nr:hypothetical protein [Pseudobutyrivibrio sp.]
MRRVILISAVVAIMAMAVGCGVSGSSKMETEDGKAVKIKIVKNDKPAQINATATAVEEGLENITYKGKKIKISTDPAFIDEFGEPESVDEGPVEYYVGVNLKSRTYDCGSMTITTVEEEGKSTFSDININNDNVELVKGIKRGATIADVVKAYGAEKGKFLCHAYVGCSGEDRAEVTYLFGDLALMLNFGGEDGTSDCCLDGSETLDHILIYNVDTYDCYTMCVDCSQPQQVQMTEEVEAGLQFAFTCEGVDYYYYCGHYYFFCGGEWFYYCPPEDNNNGGGQAGDDTWYCCPPTYGPWCCCPPPSCNYICSPWWSYCCDDDTSSPCAQTNDDNSSPCAQTNDDSNCTDDGEWYYYCPNCPSTPNNGSSPCAGGGDQSSSDGGAVFCPETAQQYYCPETYCEITTKSMQGLGGGGSNGNYDSQPQNNSRRQDSEDERRTLEQNNREGDRYSERNRDFEHNR